MERFVVLPFSIGSCASQSSVDVIENPSPAKKSKHDSDPSSITRVQGEGEGGGGGDNYSGVKVKNSISRLIKSIKTIKTISQLFVYKEDVDEEMEMEIGFPTDVKHVTHIGWDGTTSNNTTTTNPLKKDCLLWDNFKAHPNQDQFFSSLSTSSLSLKQFELAMARQANNTDHLGASTTPLVFGPSINKSKPTTTTS